MKIYKSPDVEETYVQCANSGKSVKPSEAVWHNIGISHYNKEKGVSYIQIHDTPYCVNDNHAIQHAHKRADQHASLTHGVHDSATLNPNKKHQDDLVRQNAEYSPLGRGWATLPRVDALTGQALGDDIYVPHVDRWSNKPNASGGVQGGSHQATGELGTSTLEGCIRLIHVIIDEVLAPKEVPSES